MAPSQSQSVEVFTPGIRTSSIATEYGLDPNIDVDSPAASFWLHNRLTGRAQPEGFDASVHAEVLIVGSIRVNLILNTLPQAEWNEINFPGLVIASLDENTRARIIGALGVLSIDSAARGLFAAYVRNLFVLEKHVESARLITSASVPDYPFSIFISERAFRHIPPLTVSDVPSLYLGAENFYHEAVHQAVSHSIITNGLLPSTYTSLNSPKIPIYWREEDVESRNTAWELDRVLHAASVYVHLLSWRTRLLGSHVLNSLDERLTVAALEEALPAVNTLVKALEEHRDAFTATGNAYIDRLVKAFDYASQQAEGTLRPVKIVTLATS